MARRIALKVGHFPPDHDALHDWLTIQQSLDILIDFTNGMNCHDLPPKRTKKPAQDMGLAASDSV